MEKKWNELKNYFKQKEISAQEQIDTIRKSIDVENKTGKLVQWYVESSCFRHAVDMMEVFELDEINKFL